ncbi:MAG TPA: hypothetical protein DCM64_08310 [Gammaproteobacteria bacterium]|jgi:hypothetical protein|nr:hypothetical protein [Gammaproteobacteria bacterium]HAJ76447.1 hypothetical protein [Gammaproteobacteria bacterium]
MKISLRQILISLASLLVSIATVIYISQNPAQYGSEPLLLRALILNLAILAALVAVFPINPLFNDKPGAYGLAVCLPAMTPGFFYFLFFLPGQAGAGIAAEQLQSQLITDSSSNAIIEVGFRYPIYTPTISLQHQDIFTKQVNVFLRMTDANGENLLYRGVRSRISGTGLSVEATVQGMLSENTGYLFNPIALPPHRETQGRVVFIISNLEEGTTFSEAVGRANQAQFELRDPENGQLLLEFPLNRI